MKKLMLSLSAALCTCAAIAQTTPAAPAVAAGKHHAGQHGPDKAVAPAAPVKK